MSDENKKSAPPNPGPAEVVKAAEPAGKPNPEVKADVAAAKSAAAATPAPAAPSSGPPMVKLTIDGIEVSVAPGTTIIKAAEKAGKFIPHFCYHPGLPVVGQCRMCFVEVEKMPKLATACSQPVGEGMIVRTDSEKVRDGQNSTLEFTLLNHPLDCPICDRGGECKLQDYTYEYGPPTSRMTDDKVLRDKHKAISEQVVLDQERCILCTRCVRFSADVDGRAEIVVNNRGNANVVDVFENRPLESNYSGNVVDLCPVGALTAKDFRFVARPWELKNHQAICTGCSGGCNVNIDTKHRHAGIVRPDKQLPVPHIVRLKPRENTQVNQWWMCDKGRWGYHFHNEDEQRLTQPHLRRTRGVASEPVSLREIQAFIETQPKAHWEFWIDDTLPHEGIAWARELAQSWSARGRTVGRLNDTPFAREFLEFWAARAASPWMAGPAEWQGITTVVAPMDVRQLENVAGILALRLGQSVRKGALKWEKKSVAEFASVPAGDHVAYLALPPRTSADIAALKALPAASKLLLLFQNANSRGLLNEGIAPVEVLGPSLQNEKPKGPVFVFRQRTQAPLTPGLVSYAGKASFLVVADSFRSELSDRADVTLPLTPLYESEATLTNVENRRQVSKGIHVRHPNVAAIDRGGAVVSPSLRLL